MQFKKKKQKMYKVLQISPHRLCHLLQKCVQTVELLYEKLSIRVLKD